MRRKSPESFFLSVITSLCALITKIGLMTGIDFSLPGYKLVYYEVFLLLWLHCELNGFGEMPRSLHTFITPALQHVLLKEKHAY